VARRAEIEMAWRKRKQLMEEEKIMARAEKKARERMLVERLRQPQPTGAAVREVKKTKPHKGIRTMTPTTAGQDSSSDDALAPKAALSAEQVMQAQTEQRLTVARDERLMPSSTTSDLTDMTEHGEAKEMDADGLFEQLMLGLVRRHHGEVSKRVANHTQEVWHTQSDRATAQRVLAEKAAMLVWSGTAATTKQTYASACRTYEHFCLEFGLVAYDLTDTQLTLFVTFSFERVRVSSIETYLTAVVSTARQLGKAPPELSSLPRLQRALQGARYAERAQKGGYFRLPITMKMLQDMVGVALRRPMVHQTGLGNPLQRATMYTVAFFGALRPGELTERLQSCGTLSMPLRRQNVVREEVFNPITGKKMAMWLLFLESSKTDRLGERSEIALGQTGADLCPVGMMDAWLAVLGRPHGGEVPAEALLFPNENQTRPVAYKDFLEAVREDLAAAGYDTTKYAGHSFRIGCATTLATNGVPDHLIQAIGRWQSDCYKRYIRIQPERRAMMSAFLHCQYTHGSDLRDWASRLAQEQQDVIIE
jgi:hypothetical protein